MELPKLDYYFDYGGACVWNVGAVEPSSLPISDSLLKELKDLSNEHDGQIDWNDGSDLWTQEHRDDFHHRAAIVGKKLQEELFGKYIVINHFEEYL